MISLGKFVTRNAISTKDTSCHELLVGSLMGPCYSRTLQKDVPFDAMLLSNTMIFDKAKAPCFGHQILMFVTSLLL